MRGRHEPAGQALHALDHGGGYRTSDMLPLLPPSAVLNVDSSPTSRQTDRTVRG